MTPKLKALFDKATARPWKTGSNYPCRIMQANVKASDLIASTCEFENEGTERPIEKANARLVTLAANHMQALVEALENCVQVMCESGPSAFDTVRELSDEELGKMWISVAKQARSVLIAIEKELSE